MGNLVIEGFSFGDVKTEQPKKTEAVEKIEETISNVEESVEEITVEAIADDVLKKLIEEAEQENKASIKQVNLSDLVIEGIVGVGALEPMVLFVKAYGMNNLIGIPGFLNHQSGEFVLLENGGPIESPQFNSLFKEYVEKAKNELRD